MERFTIVVATAFGIESVTKRELLSFGIDDLASAADFLSRAISTLL